MKLYTIIASSSLILYLVLNQAVANYQSDKSNTQVPKYIAWTESDIHDYKFAITESNKFIYTIFEKDSMTSKKDYAGTITKCLHDTVFLKYDKNNRPQNFCGYLIIEASGQYLIQKFKNSSKRIFLRIRRRDRFGS
jgi:hypothetical protein